MPSTMIHLSVAHEVEPEAPDFFWIGNFAPDYTNDTALKDQIHLRNTPDRWASLEKLYEEIDKENPFERGWVLHLFVDAYWDVKQILEYRDWYISTYAGENWFPHYREEIGWVSYYLYHHLPWSKNIWSSIKDAKLVNINSSLPITLAENEWYRDRVARKHAESDPMQIPQLFTEDRIMDFSLSTANRYREWISAHSESI